MQVHWHFLLLRRQMMQPLASLQLCLVMVIPNLILLGRLRSLLQAKQLTLGRQTQKL